MQYGQDDEGQDPPAGLPSARSNKMIFVVATAILAIPFLAIIGYAAKDFSATTFGDDIGEFSIAALETPAEKSLTLSAGREILFGVATDYVYSGNPVVMLDVALLRGGSEIAKKECNMKEFTGFGGDGSGRTTWYGDAGWHCTLEVPEGGAASIRATIRKAGKGTLELSHTSVLVKGP